MDPLTQWNKTCPAGWTKFNCSCYFLFTETGSWTEGRQDCRTRGADLVVIDSDEEQTFLSNLTDANVWIGLTDEEQENTWKWIDGTPLTLSYWEKNQPDNGAGQAKWGEEDCVHIRTGWKTKNNWNDRSCRASLHWICEKKA
uniref:C-type lectin domain-containing protein n=1 Tax=Anabas testudineus TaxID=64144 RepID=A0A3Q1JHY8_ANATE